MKKHTIAVKREGTEGTQERRLKDRYDEAY